MTRNRILNSSLGSLLRSTQGFSLIEIMIVVFIIGLIAVVSVPAMRGFSRTSVRSGATELSVLINEAAIGAQANGKIYRVVYNVGKGEYWAEYTSDELLLDSAEAKKVREERKSFFDDKEEKKEATFIQDKNINRKKRSLPVGVKFLKVYTEQSEDPIEEGEAYTHIFPHGQTERGIVQLAGGDENIVSVVVLGLLGKTQIEGRPMTFKDGFNAPR